LDYDLSCDYDLRIIWVRSLSATQKLGVSPISEERLKESSRQLGLPGGLLRPKLRRDLSTFVAQTVAAGRSIFALNTRMPVLNALAKASNGDSFTAILGHA
jgi:hypothetical protein